MYLAEWASHFRSEIKLQSAIKRDLQTLHQCKVDYDQDKGHLASSCQFDSFDGLFSDDTRWTPCAFADYPGDECDIIGSVVKLFKR